MPVKKDADTNGGEGVLAKRVSRRVREADFVYQGGARERGSSKKGLIKGRHSQQPFFNRLVKIELDVAEALADFSRLAHMTSKHSPNDLKWSAKRRRSTRSYEVASSPQLESHTQQVAVKNHIPFGDSQRNELDNMTSILQSDKASPLFNCQAESPSSPLPTSKLACSTFLVNRGLSSKSAFQRVIPAEPIQKPTLTPIKTEMEDMQPELFAPDRPLPQTSRAPMSLCSVKTEQLGEQEEDCKDFKSAGTMTLTNLASQLVKLSHEVGPAILNKPKAGLSEEDKEARRLRRIQANRESARQTIRKKQILCEELRRQAVSLTLENEGMKQKKETLMQELYFLKGQNYHLKNELEMGPPCKLEPEMLQHSQGIPANLPAWQATTLPYTGFPSHLFGWPRMLVQGGVANCTDWPNKIESLEEHSRHLAGDQSMQLLSTVLIVPGIPISSPMCATGFAEQKCSHISNDASFLVPTSSHDEESGAAGEETLKSSGASCDVDSATSNAQKGIEKEVDVIPPTKLESANTMQERGAKCQPTAIVPFRGDHSGSGEKQSRLRAAEKMDMGLPVANLSVTCGSSCTGSIGSIPLNGSGLADLYARRTTQCSAVVAAAAARKRRMELTRKKRSCSKR